MVLTTWAKFPVDRLAEFEHRWESVREKCSVQCQTNLPFRRPNDAIDASGFGLKRPVFNGLKITKQSILSPNSEEFFNFAAAQLNYKCHNALFFESAPELKIQVPCKLYILLSLWVQVLELLIHFEAHYREEIERAMYEKPSEELDLDKEQHESWIDVGHTSTTSRLSSGKWWEKGWRGTKTFFVIQD